MDLDDRVSIVTPEGVELALQLAGLGSRFIAGVADLTIQVVSIVILAVLTGGVGGGGGLLEAVFAIAAFAIWFFYNVLFEVLAGGRTPGKAMNHLRVVRRSGAPVDFTASAIRNLLRLIDGPTLLYIPSIVSIAVTRLHQRPGDMAAGTLVVREQALRTPRTPPSPGPLPLGAASEPGGDASLRWEVSAVTPAELAAVRQFLQRRETLERRARAELAVRLASGLRSKVSGAPEGIPAERFLETIARVKSGQR